jgi:hypothetical protein
MVLNQLSKKEIEFLKFLTNIWKAPLSDYQLSVIDAFSAS